MRLLSLAPAAALVLVAAAASGQTFVGNTVSTFESTSEGNIPEEPDEVIVASLAVPAKYRGKKHFLLVTSSVQASCQNGLVRSYLTIDGVEVTLGPTECSFVPHRFQSRQWSFPPTSQGGPSIAPGALVELRMRAIDATAQYATRSVRVEIAD